jgi:hypothetical protein
MPSTDAWDYYTPSDDRYLWADAYNSADTSDYRYMITSVDCPIHNTTAACSCITDMLSTLYPGEINAQHRRPARAGRVPVERLI